MIQHRNDIDGLRAVAVGLVVLFHLDFPVSGGFVGVDVFFVISGYLITAILRDDLASGRYSLLEFYQRRARRILPALAVVLLASTLAALVLLLPSGLRGYGLSLASTGLFASNFYFWSDAGYFAGAAESRPLLHTWSLAVEEQFYLLFPLLLAFFHRHARSGLRLALAALAVGSLLYSEWQLRRAPEGAFYLLPSRAWELLLGSLLAMGSVPRIRNAALRQGLGWLGLAAIVYAACTYTEKTRFPGLAALAPCLGAALLIHSGGDTQVARLLALRPVRFVGLISYSLYLWHWPLIVFYREGLLGDYGLPQRLGLLAASLALAVLSWRYVETPFRQLDRHRWPAARLLPAAVAALLGTVALGALLRIDGLPQRFSPAERAMAAWLDYDRDAQFRAGRCFLSSGGDFRQYDTGLCLAESEDRPDVLLIGDSHAGHLWEGLARQFPEINLQQATASGCLPLLKAEGAARCTKLMRYIFEQHLTRHRPDAILLSALWPGWKLDELVSTVHYLRQYSPRVVVLGPVTGYRIGEHYRVPLPQLLALSQHRQQPELIGQYLSRERLQTDQTMRQRFAAEGLEYVSAIDPLCANAACRTLTPEGVPMQFDHGHLTPDGARWLAGQWRDSGALDF
ncbi:acyltransferase [Stagnimonas aquatica]|uniref:Acyltransferase n=1 Tax=Stagnimonas aquatica TaxID=2689987 RepID=A0A3N0VLA0_9GAMM|nr:acyltransferase family protein [Stagnimonas aquatica]ROH93517.1 acyltransferase [Stagnimonas aquatica]